jgi:hypothetical protein
VVKIPIYRISDADYQYNGTIEQLDGIVHAPDGKIVRNNDIIYVVHTDGSTNRAYAIYLRTYAIFHNNGFRYDHVFSKEDHWREFAEKAMYNKTEV